jgi:hypothetical protein
MALSNPHMALPNSVLKRSNTHYLHFYVDEFLAESHDAQLRVEFPSELLKARLGDGLYASLDLLDGTAEVEEFLARSSIWREYRDTFRSSQWLETVLQQFRKEIVARYPFYLQPILGNRTLNPSNLEVSVALSFSRRGFHLSPHSDDKYKVLTLIHYLPEQSGAETSGGTRFFVPRPNCSIAELRSFSEWSRGIRKYLPFFRIAPSTEISLKRRYEEDDIHDELERARFENLFSVGDYVEYRANRMSGFVKNNWTLHEVDLCDFPPDQFRRAALINVRLKQRWWTRIVPGIERVLSHIKRAIRSHS